MSAEKTMRRCVTCGKELAEGDAEINNRLRHFDDYCICKTCAAAYKAGRENKAKVQA
jgi:hypothetical protein